MPTWRPVCVNMLHAEGAQIGPSADMLRLLMHRALVAEHAATDARNRYHAALGFDPADVG